jgi:putative peptidoglycan lipid II flippase
MREQSTSSSTRAAFGVMVLTALSRVLGFVREAAVAAVWGTSATAGIITVTFNVPNNLRKLMAEGALSSAFIPSLSRAVAKGDESTARKITNKVLNFQLAVLIPFCVAAAIFARPLVVYVLAEWTDPSQIDLATGLLRYFIWYTVLISLSAVLMAVLNSHHVFSVPAITPILFSLTVIPSVLLLHESLGAYALVVGVLTGGVAQVLYQSPKFRSLGYSYRPDFDFRDPDFLAVIRQWLPILATSAVFTVNQVVAMRFASGLADVKSASAFHYGLVLWQLPAGIFGVAVTTVLFPKMSRQAGVGDSDGLRDTIQYGVRMLVSLLIPIAVIMAVLSKEIVSVVYMRRAFGPEGVALTAQILVAFSFGLFSVKAYEFTQRFFYSVGDFKTPLYVSSAVVVVDVVLSLWWKETDLAVAGLAYALAASFTLGLVANLWFARKRLGGLKGRKLAVTLAKVGLSTVVVYLLLQWVHGLMPVWWDQGFSLARFGLLAAEGLGALGVLLVLYRVLNVEILAFLLNRGRK